MAHKLISLFRRRAVDYRFDLGSPMRPQPTSDGHAADGPPPASTDSGTTQSIDLKAIVGELTKDEERLLTLRRMNQEYATAYQRGDSGKCGQINEARPRFHRPYLERRVAIYGQIVQSDSEETRDTLKDLLESPRWFIRQFAAEALTFLGAGRVDLSKDAYPIFCKHVTHMVSSNRDYMLLAYRSNFFFQYYDLADFQRPERFVPGYGPSNSYSRQLACEALSAAGPEAVEDILKVYSEIIDSPYARTDLADVLMKIDDPRGKSVVLEDLLGDRLRGHTAPITRWVLADIKKGINQVFRGDGTDDDKRRRMSGFLTALDAQGQGRMTLFCECGYPAQVRYTDGSVGPIHGLGVVECEEEYTNIYKCGHCGRFIARITT